MIRSGRNARLVDLVTNISISYNSSLVAFASIAAYPESDNGDFIPRRHLDGRLDRRKRHDDCFYRDTILFEDEQIKTKPLGLLREEKLRTLRYLRQSLAINVGGPNLISLLGRTDVGVCRPGLHWVLFCSWPVQKQHYYGRYIVLICNVLWYNSAVLRTCIVFPDLPFRERLGLRAQGSVLIDKRHCHQEAMPYWATSRIALSRHLFCKSSRAVFLYPTSTITVTTV